MKDKKRKKFRITIITKKSIRKLLESQYAEEKERLWQRIKKRLEEEEKNNKQ